MAGGYDANQNLTNDGSRQFGYDGENRLTGTGGGGTTPLALVYDPLGRLQQTTAGTGASAVVTRFIYDGDRLIAELGASGTTVLRRYVHGAGVDEPVLWWEGSGTTDGRSLLADRQGSIVATAPLAGGTSAVSLYAYGPYGERTSWGGSRFAYTGQIALPEASLYHYKARAYDPARGWFLQTDPIGYEAGDFNLYAYVGGDPVNRRDPSGKTCTQTPAGTQECKVDEVQKAKDRPLTKDEKSQIASFNKAYTAVVNKLAANPDAKVDISVGKKTITVKAGDLAKTLAARKFVAMVGTSGTAGTGANNTTYVFDRGLAGTIDPRDKPDFDRQVTVAHEGIHRGPGEKAAFPSPDDPATNDESHGTPYDNASKSLINPP